MAKADNKVEIFINEMLSGKSQRQSYYIAYPHSKKWKETTVDVRASELMAESKVRGRYNELVEQHRSKCIIDRKELLRMSVKGLKIAIGEEYSNEEIINYETDAEGNEREIKKKAKLKGTDLKSLKGLVEIIAKMEGFITEKVESKNVNINVNTEMTDDELIKSAKKLGVEID